MIYTLERDFERSIIPWTNIFWCLSIEQFRQVYDLLDFPFSPSDELRQVAHDYSLTYMSLLRGYEYADALEMLLNNGEAVVFNLLEGKLPDDPYGKKCEALFTNTFAHLEQLGNAEVVYQWGKQTESYQQYANRQQYLDLQPLGYWCDLLRIWAVMEWMKQPIASAHRLYTPDWDQVMTRFVPIYEERGQSIGLLPLSHTVCERLQAIILHHEARRQRLAILTDAMMTSPKSTWEEIALRNHGAINSISLEGRMRINLHEGNMIVDALSSDDLSVLEQWAQQYEKISARQLKLSLH